MVDRSRHLVKRMVDNITSVSEKFNRSICKQYDKIVKNITNQSEKTDELVAQMKYVESLRAGELLQLKVMNTLQMFTGNDDIVLTNAASTQGNAYTPNVHW